LARKKVVIPDERSEIRNPEPFELRIPWMPDQVRHDGKNNFPEAVIDFIFVLTLKNCNHGPHEGRQVVRFPAGDQVAVHHHLLIDPFRPGMNQVVFNGKKGYQSSNSLYISSAKIMTFFPRSSIAPQFIKGLLIGATS